METTDADTEIGSSEPFDRIEGRAPIFVVPEALAKQLLAGLPVEPDSTVLHGYDKWGNRFLVLLSSGGSPLAAVVNNMIEEEEFEKTKSCANGRACGRKESTSNPIRKYKLCEDDGHHYWLKILNYCDC